MVVIFQIGNTFLGALAACACMLAVFYFSCRIMKGGARRTLLWAGIALMVMSTILDVGSTLLHSPTLELEGNPFVRLMLDNGTPHTWVVSSGLVFQTIFLLTACFIWSSFCGSLDEYAKRLGIAASQESFFWGMYGIKGKGLSLLLGKVDYFMFINGVAPLLVGVFLYRIYLSLEWNGLVPISRIAAPVTSIAAVSMVQYFYFKRLVSERNQDWREPRDDS